MKMVNWKDHLLEKQVQTLMQYFFLLEVQHDVEVQKVVVENLVEIKIGLVDFGVNYADVTAEIPAVVVDKELEQEMEMDEIDQKIGKVDCLKWIGLAVDIHLEHNFQEN